MGVLGGMFPTGSMCDRSSSDAAFFWYNVASVVGLVACACYVLGLVLLLLLVGLLPLAMWVGLNFVFFVLQVVAFVFHLLAAVGDAGVGGGLKRMFASFGLSKDCVNTLGLYNLLLHLLSCTGMWITQVGFITIFLSYILAAVALVLAYVIAKKDL